MPVKKSKIRCLTAEQSRGSGKASLDEVGDALEDADVEGVCATLADASGGSCDVGLDGLEGVRGDEAGAEGAGGGVEALEGALAGWTSGDGLGDALDGISDGVSA